MLSPTCQRARFVAALSLDEEPSELDARSLERHLAGCADCRAFDESVRGFTHRMRLAEPDEIAVRVPPAPSHGLQRFVSGSITAAALAGAAAVGGVAFAIASGDTLTRQQQQPRSLPALVISVGDEETSQESQAFLHAARDAALARSGAPSATASGRPGVQVD